MRAYSPAAEAKAQAQAVCVNMQRELSSTHSFEVGRHASASVTYLSSHRDALLSFKTELLSVTPCVDVNLAFRGVKDSKFNQIFVKEILLFMMHN